MSTTRTMGTNGGDLQLLWRELELSNEEMMGGGGWQR